jgi:TATA element modulatory factor
MQIKEEAESKNSDNYKKLEKTCVFLEKELNSKKLTLDESEEKIKSLENTLQNAYKELAELHKSNAAKDTRINETTNSIETQLKEEIERAVEKERTIAGKKQESLKWELQSVRADISRIEQQHSLREDMLRKEISDLQQVN